MNNAAFQRALQTLHSGDAVLAEQLLQEVVAQTPDHAAAWHQLGVISFGRGDWDEAAERFAQALRVDYANPTHLGWLALTMLERGDVEAAVSGLERAVQLGPNDPSLHFNLAVALQTAGRLSEAEAAYRQSLTLAPNSPPAWVNLGVVVMNQQRPQESLTAFERALRLNPSSVSAWNNMGLAYLAMEQFDEAHQRFEQAAQQAPDDPFVTNNLGLTWREHGESRKALECFQRAAANRADYDDALHNLGCAWIDLGEMEQADEALRQALQVNPQRADSLVQLGVAAAQQGRFAEATKRFREALDVDSEYAEAYFQLSLLGGESIDDNDIGRLEQLAEGSTLSLPQRRFAHFALANAYDRRDDYANAFERADAGNQLYSSKFDAKRHSAVVDEIIAAFTAGSTDDASTEASGVCPVFIVGMPRSGTTLLEQMLDRHPSVQGCGELAIISKLADRATDSGRRSWATALSRLRPETLEPLRREFHQSYAINSPSIESIVDKTPNNFLYIGFIARLFPEARLIHCRRDARDVCLSCYFRNFHNQPWTTDLANIAAYYRDYERIMTHWLETLSISITTVDYEQLVSDPEPQCRRLVESCGLAWDDRCLEFHRSERIVATASNWQVRQPIYKRSIGRWKAYRDQLSPLLEALELE